MSEHALTTIQDCEDFISGCRFMGTGGGGGVDWGLDMLRAALEDGLPLEWTNLADIPDDAWTCTAFGMGSIAPQDDSTSRAIEALGLTDRLGFNAMAQAVRELAAHTGKPISVIVPSELGAGNTPAPLVSAARLGVTCVDGDYAGRAIPDEMQGTPYLYGKTSHPLASVDQWVCWQLVDGRKIPKQPSGINASSTNPDTWRSLAACAQAVVSKGMTGLGFVFR